MGFEVLFELAALAPPLMHRKEAIAVSENSGKQALDGCPILASLLPILGPPCSSRISVQFVNRQVGAQNFYLRPNSNLCVLPRR